MNELVIGGATVLIGLVVWLASIYRIVPPEEAHYVVSSGKKMVCSPDEKLRQEGGTTYFAIPSFIPAIGRKVRIIDVTIKELLGEQETYEKDQARYKVRYSLKYRISDAAKSAETSTSEEELQKQLEEQVKSAVRAITVRYNVVEARANKQKMADEIKTEIEDDLAQWGLTLITFALVDFQDTADSKIITNISKRREVDIESSTRQENAQKFKEARLKEAEADEEAQKREILRDESVAKRKQEKDKIVAEAEKIKRDAEFEVVKVNAIKQAQIDKDRQEIVKQQKQLEGEGEKLRLTEMAKGEAAKIRENGFAEAEAKEKLQDALNKFKDEAIRALVAEKVVAMQQAVGIESAKALATAKMSVFASGTQQDKTGFDLGKLIEAISVNNSDTARAIMNRLARPNDLGFAGLTEEPIPKVTKNEVD